MIKLLIASMLGVLLSVGTSLALVSSQTPADLDAEQSILSSYGER